MYRDIKFYIVSITLCLFVIWFLNHSSKKSNIITHGVQHRCNTSCPFRGQKSKCYSCERQAYQRSNGNECAIFNEHPMKFYEPTHLFPAMGYAKMGYL